MQITSTEKSKSYLTQPCLPPKHHIKKFLKIKDKEKNLKTSKEMSNTSGHCNSHNGRLSSRNLIGHKRMA
jgi:hypothetical protein